MYRTVFWTLWERERVGRFGRMALKHVYYHVWNESPVQLRCTILDIWGWCTGTTQREGMGREEGGGFRMGSTCIPVADSFRYLAKPIQYCKVKKKKILLPGYPAAPPPPHYNVTALFQSLPLDSNLQQSENHCPRSVLLNFSTYHHHLESLWNHSSRKSPSAEILTQQIWDAASNVHF